MGYKEYDIKVPVNIGNIELHQVISHTSKIKKFTYQILKKSLDSRHKNRIVWLYRIGIVSNEIKDGVKPIVQTLHPEYRTRNKRVVIVGSGPAGIFSAIFLALSGFKVTIIEQGSKVEERKIAIDDFECNRKFSPLNNYSFGEGGAGTFSDGKLTSRTKTINRERNFIYEQLISVGAPSEIQYMTHPHLGSDNLFKITQKIRVKLQELGCTYLFNSKLIDINQKGNRIASVNTSNGTIESDYFIFATGLASYETYRMLIRNGIPYHLKNFALGFRAEHMQEIINHAQWGVANIPGEKAAEYRLTAQCSDNTGVYSFCMCPGGIVVPSTAYAHTNIVNGMSLFNRDNKWANAAVVATINLEKLLNQNVSVLEAIDWLEALESDFYKYAKGYDAPASRILDFITGKIHGKIPESSYPFNTIEADFNELLPAKLIHPLKEGLAIFCKKMKGYESGIILGLESKTSSQLQVERDSVKMNTKYENLFIAGEGSGWAGGIISSAADSLKVAQRLSSN
jgi:uncharacterized protein